MFYVRNKWKIFQATAIDTYAEGADITRTQVIYLMLAADSFLDATTGY